MTLLGVAMIMGLSLSMTLSRWYVWVIFGLFLNVRDALCSGDFRDARDISMTDSLGLAEMQIWASAFPHAPAPMISVGDVICKNP